MFLKTFSSAVKNDFVQFLFLLILLLVSAAAEELLPVFGGVGFPLLLAAVMAVSPRQRILAAVFTAVGAGALEDALAALPPLASIGFFTFAALTARKRDFPQPALIVLFPLYTLWAGMCAAGSMGDVFWRMLVSLPFGAAAFAVSDRLSAWGAGKAGLDG